MSDLDEIRQKRMAELQAQQAAMHSKKHKGNSSKLRKNKFWVKF